MKMSTDDLEQTSTMFANMEMFKTANEFSLYIEEMVRDRKLSYMEAVLEYCEQNYLEPSDISKLINQSLKDKIEMEFRELNYLPKQGTLDI